MLFTITIVIIAITVIVSLTAFNSEKVMNDLIFYPPAVTDNKQYYRFITSGLIHADFFHLIFNMYALYLFGSSVEAWFGAIFEEKGKLLYLVMYISALVISLLPTYLKHKDNANYRSLGASGAVSAAVFANILVEPIRGIGLVFIPGIYIPGFLFGVIYLGVSSYLDKRGGGNINHSAHIWGALYGIGFFIVASFIFSDYNVLMEFIRKIQEYISGF